MDKSQGEELESLRNHKDKLLGELKVSKQKLAESNSRIDELEEQCKRNDEQLHRYRFTSPVEETLSEMFLIDPDLALQQVQKHFTVGFDAENDKLFINSLDGEKIVLEDKPGAYESEKRYAEFTRDDLEAVFSKSGKFDAIMVGSRASGSGCSSSNVSNSYPQSTQSTTDDKSATSQFGLR